jgi:three-Cys-motif partner protein
MTPTPSNRAVGELDSWPEIKLDIVREYATACSEVLSKRPGLHHVYVEAFGGPGVRLAPATHELVPGSPLNAMAIQPPFKEYFLIDLDGGRSEELRRLTGNRPGVHVLEGDCNRLLLETIFPLVREEDYRRGLCVLDPNGLYLDWNVIATAGHMQTLEFFFEFPMKAVERLVLDRDRAGLPAVLQPMDRFWGDDSWRSIALPAEKKLYGDEPVKVSQEAIVESYHHRLLTDAGFPFVPKPMPMDDANGEVVGYLFFASHNVLGGKIVQHLFEKHAHDAGKS